MRIYSLVNLEKIITTFQDNINILIFLNFAITNDGHTSRAKSLEIQSSSK
jgi:hypothetical protein